MLDVVTIAAVEFMRRKNSKAFNLDIEASLPNDQEAPMVDATKMIA
jgi:hypothetical protein